MSMSAPSCFISIADACSPAFVFFLIGCSRVVTTLCGCKFALQGLRDEGRPPCANIWPVNNCTVQYVKKIENYIGTWEWCERKQNVFDFFFTK